MPPQDPVNLSPQIAIRFSPDAIHMRLERLVVFHPSIERTPRIARDPKRGSRALKRTFHTPRCRAYLLPMIPLFLLLFRPALPPPGAVSGNSSGQRDSSSDEFSASAAPGVLSDDQRDGSACNGFDNR